MLSWSLFLALSWGFCILLVRVSLAAYDVIGVWLAVSAVLPVCGCGRWCCARVAARFVVQWDAVELLDESPDPLSLSKCPLFIHAGTITRAIL